LGEYIRAANENTAVIVQAKHIDAMHTIDAIVAVDGIDAVFIGPYDCRAASDGLTKSITLTFEPRSIM
jgi:2-keto-3-deoxy-L-rhamnonate aldolase RhmA